MIHTGESSDTGLLPSIIFTARTFQVLLTHRAIVNAQSTRAILVGPTNRQSDYPPKGLVGDVCSPPWWIVGFPIWPPRHKSFSLVPRGSAKPAPVCVAQYI